MCYKRQTGYYFCREQNTKSSSEQNGGGGERGQERLLGAVDQKQLVARAIIPLVHVAVRIKNKDNDCWEARLSANKEKTE